MSQDDSVVERGKELARKAATTHPVRTWQTYLAGRGNVLAGGMAYAGLFSIGSALVVGFTVFGLVLGRRSDLRDPLLEAIDAQLPGLLDLGDGGLVQPTALFATDALSLTGVVALAVALYAGLGWLDATREGIRTVFGLERDDRPLVRKKLLDVVVLATLGVTVLASAVLSVGVNATAGVLLRWVGLDGSSVGELTVRAAGVLLVFIIDTVVFVVMFRLLSGVPLTWRQVRVGALLGAVGLGLLKLFGGLLLGSAGGSNPVLAASATLVGLLLWMNIVSRIVLLAAAWVSSDTSVEEERARRVPVGAGAGDPARAGVAARAGVVDLPVAAGPRDVMAPSFGQRSADRVTLAAGAVLGAVVVSGVRVLRGAIRAVADGVRGD